MKMFSFILLGVFSLSAHSQQVISYDKSEEVDFDKYSSYKFYKLDVASVEILQNNKEGIENIKMAIALELNRRGLNEDQSNDSNLLINIGLTITDEVQTRKTDIRDAPIYMGTRNYHWESEEIVIDEYQAGTIVIDLIDAEKNEMVWQGVVKGVISKKDEKNKKTVNKAIAKVFKKYPVKPSKKG